VLELVEVHVAPGCLVVARALDDLRATGALHGEAYLSKPALPIALSLGSGLG
jgi:hypothetical protein